MLENSSAILLKSKTEDDNLISRDTVLPQIVTLSKNIDDFKKMTSERKATFYAQNQFSYCL